MMEADESSHHERSVPLNPVADSQPLKDAVICCTSVPDEKRTEFEQLSQQMGATYRHDLTLDVTHLIVGLYDTPKYRYVAKERPDVRPMTMGWLDALRELWIEDKEIDVEAMEKQHILPVFNSLKFSMTGCDDPSERIEIAEQVKANGGVYEGDLTKQITHLISFRTEGAKYKAAKLWGLRIVSVEWLRDSLERGMILDEALYDPTMPTEERGKNAWDRTKPKRTSLGKRSRDDSMGALEGAKRKLRRTASTKLASQTDQMWGDIVGGPGTVLQVARSMQWAPTDEAPETTLEKREPPPEPNAPIVIEPPRATGFFSGCRFYFDGFTTPKRQILSGHLIPQDAEIAMTVEELLGCSSVSLRLFRVVPSDLPVSEHPSLPVSDLKVETVTVWWIERCLHYKKFVDPWEHIIGRPFPKFPIPELQEMIISTAAFTGVDLLHVSKAVSLVGAQYSQDLTKNSSMLLTKTTTGLRKDKVDFAREWKVPIVDARWLWDSIEAGARLPLQKYRFREQKRSDSVPAMSNKPPTIEPEERKTLPVLKPEKTSTKTAARLPRNSKSDTTSFISDEPAPEPAPPVKQEIDSQKRDPFPNASNSTSDLSSIPLSERPLNSPSRTVSTAPAPSDHPHSHNHLPPPEENISNAITNLLRKTRNPTPANSDIPTAQTKKRSRILGRATSNMSAVSTPFSRATSVDSTATHGNPVEYPSTTTSTEKGKERDTAARKSANEKIEEFIKMRNAGEVVEEQERPSTQLQYEDPESAAYKESLMARMLGGKVEVAKGKGAKGMERAPTIADGVKAKGRVMGGIGDRPLRRRARVDGGKGLR